MKITTVSHLFLCIIIFSCSQKFDGKNGVYEEFYPESSVLKKSVEYKNGKKNGKYAEYYYSKKIKEEATLINSAYDGPRKKYYETGALKSEENFSKGERNGWSKFYAANGQLKSEALYSDNKCDGPFNSYFDDGKPHKLYNFSKGLHHGELKEYYENGQLKSIAYYKNGCPGLGLKEYTEKGKEINNDFEIIYKEKNTLLLDGEFYFTVTIPSFYKNDKLYEVKLRDGKYVCVDGEYTKLFMENNTTKRHLYPTRGEALFYELNLAAVKKTAFNNEFVKTKTINISISPNI